MLKLPRRLFIQSLGSIPVIMSLGWSKKAQALVEEVCKEQGAGSLGINPSLAQMPSGYLAIIQGPTSDTESLMNILTPRLKKYIYEVTSTDGKAVVIENYERVVGPGFYHIDKLKISGLNLGSQYTLVIKDGKTVLDHRIFKALDVRKADPNFAFASCISDDHRFEASINPMWERMRKESPDFIILNGDLVYVDSFEFVERKKATEMDLWQRYVDTLKRIPLYHWQQLVPIFAVWDDHDFGTNDGDRDFISKDAAARLFRGCFGGKELAGVWSQGPQGVSSVLTAFDQKIYLMDDRTFRQPNKNQNPSEDYGHWGQAQHEWLMSGLAASTTPAWVMSGNQFFNGQALDFKEAFEANHPKEFVTFIEQLKALKAPIIFGSGDVHISEIMKVPSDRTGYLTYEVTSSCMHSFLGNGWENPMRLEGAYAKDFNFMMIKSRNQNGGLKVDIMCLGLPADPYFVKSLEISKK